VLEATGKLGDVLALLIVANHDANDPNGPETGLDVGGDEIPGRQPYYGILSTAQLLLHFTGHTGTFENYLPEKGKYWTDMAQSRLSRDDDD
jgi:hypothetical protein